jgi:hypothetical protein
MAGVVDDPGRLQVAALETVRPATTAEPLILVWADVLSQAHVVRRRLPATWS